VAVHVTAPVGGMAVGLANVPDHVFASAMVGPGLAIDPDRAPGTVVSPVTGTLVKLKPHALVVRADGGRGVLVHLGIDTIRLGGEGFTLLAAEGDAVKAGHPLVRWRPAEVEARGLSPLCPVVALDADCDSVAGFTYGPVDIGSPLFVWK
jgi:PTS system N-acetylglucosamine-specific IIA component